MLSDRHAELKSEMKSCQLCLEAGYDIHPGAIFSGLPPADVMIIGQAPGITETEAGRPFNATSGTRLFEWLSKAGWKEDEFRGSQYMTSITKCYPGKNQSGHGDRVPSTFEQKLCWPFLTREISLVHPILLIPIGRLSINHFIPSFRTLNEVIGRCCFIEYDQIDQAFPISTKKSELTTKATRKNCKEGFWTVPLPHPSGASLWPNQDHNKALITAAIQIIQEVRSVYSI